MLSGEQAPQILVSKIHLFIYYGATNSHALQLT